jgi:hypothetical protein
VYLIFENKMMRFFFLCVFLFTVLFFCPDTSGQNQGMMSNAEYVSQCKSDGWDADYLNTGANADFLNDEEKNLILATNMVRTDPQKFAELYVKEVIGYYQGKLLIYPSETPIMTKEGKTPALQLYKSLLKTTPIGILFPSPGMSTASKDHALSQSKNGRTGHGFRNASSKRLLQYGQWQVCMGENISYGPQSGHRALIALLIDDNVRSRGHRKNILNKQFNRIGVGSAEHKRYRWSFVVTYACDYVEMSN